MAYGAPLAAPLAPLVRSLQKVLNDCGRILLERQKQSLGHFILDALSAQDPGPDGQPAPSAASLVDALVAAFPALQDEGACLAEGFEFCAPVVGPLPKDEYLKALAGFKLEESFDLNAQYHLFRVDPTQTNRVWFHTRTLGKQHFGCTVVAEEAGPGVAEM